MLCGAPCSRLPCNHRCHLIMTYQHPCGGRACVVDLLLNRTLEELLTDVVETLQSLAPLMALPSCGHVFTVETMYGWMELGEVYEAAEESTVDVETGLVPRIRLRPLVETLSNLSSSTHLDVLSTKYNRFYTTHLRIRCSTSGTFRQEEEGLLSQAVEHFLLVALTVRYNSFIVKYVFKVFILDIHP